MTIYSIFTIIFTIKSFLNVTILLLRKDYLKRITNNKMDGFINVIKKDPKAPNKINNMLDRYNRLPPKYQSKIGYDTLIQNVILKELMKIKVTTITDLDTELKMKISRIKYLESSFLFLFYKW